MSQLIESIHFKSAKHADLHRMPSVPDVAIHVHQNEDGTLNFIFSDGKAHHGYAFNCPINGYYEKIEQFWTGFICGYQLGQAKKR